MVAATIVFCLFVMLFEKRTADQAQLNIDQHGKIIADDLWNFNYESISGYLKLAAESEHYESMTVTSHDGEVFQEVLSQPLSPIHERLRQFHLIPRVKLLSRIEHNGNVIGWLEVVWLSQTIFIDGYVFFALLLLLIVVHLYSRVLNEKGHLEEAVAERTRDLQGANVSLQQEIREHALAEEALLESEKKHRFLAENINDVILMLDLELRFTYISPAARKMFGCSQERLEQASIETTLTPESLQVARRVVRENLRYAQQSGDPHREMVEELEMVKAYGGRFWTEVTASFLVDEENRPAGIMGVIRDISERLQARQEREELQRKLERSKKMESLGLLAGGVAHDLNNVLSGIVSYPELLLMDLAEDDKLRKPIQIIHNSGVKAADIVQDLLTLARRGVITTEVLSLNTLIREYLDSPEYQKLIKDKPLIQVAVELDEDLPYMRGTTQSIRNAVMNLIVNATESMPSGGKVSIATHRRILTTPLKGYQTIQEGEYAVLEVKDQGEGISPKDQQRIFEPFYTKKVMGRSGTGLGLTVVWGTVEDLKGNIDINSTLGQGTVFELYFPVTEMVVSSEDLQPSDGSYLGRQETILVVDDIDYQRQIAVEILERLNYQALALASGEEAVAYLEEHTADLIILDMIMEKGMDGLDTYREILKIHPGQKAIIASGFSETDRVRQAQHLGAGAYIKKPYILEKMGQAIRRELGRDSTE